jgi:hypothetical protein
MENVEIMCQVPGRQATNRYFDNICLVSNYNCLGLEILNTLDGKSIVIFAYDANFINSANKNIGYQDFRG